MRLVVLMFLGFPSLAFTAEEFSKEWFAEYEKTLRQAIDTARIEIAEKKCNSNEIEEAQKAIMSNLANDNMTRAPEGGPYQRKFAYYDPDGNFHIVRLSGFYSLFEPGHMDANAAGFVKYPAISRREELIELAAWMRARRTCFGENKKAAEDSGFVRGKLRQL